MDYIIRGDGEQPLLALALVLCGQDGSAVTGIPNLVHRQGVQIVENPLTYCATQDDLDGLNFVDLDWLVHARQYAAVQFNGPETTTPVQSADTLGHWLTIGRGCCFDCSFCGGGRKAQAIVARRTGIVPRSPLKVVDDIERLCERGIRQISLTLDPAIMGRPYWSSLFGEMQRRKLKVGLYDELFQLPNDAFLDAFVETVDIQYSELAITPLSGSEEVRSLNGKTFSNQRLLDVLSRLRPHRVPVFVFFSLNVPGETTRTFRRTLRLAEDICRLYPPRRLRMINMLHTVDPCSPMGEKPQDYGIEVAFRSFVDYYAYCRETATWQGRIVHGTWRGYELTNKRLRWPEEMAHKWDAFCARQRARCYPVPRMW